MSARREFAIDARGHWRIPDLDLDVIVTADELRALAGPAVLVAVFDDQGRLRVRMEGLEAASQAEVLGLVRALPHIRRRAGRPPNTGQWRTREELEAELQEAIQVIRQRGLRVTNAALAREVHVDASTLQRSAQRWGVDLAALKATRITRDSA